MSMLEAVKRANRPIEPEDSIALRAVVLAAVLFAAMACLTQGVGGVGLWIAATLGIAGGFVYSHIARHRDGYVLKAGLAVGVIVAFMSFISSMSGAGPSAVLQVQVPLAELFLWVQVLHSLDVPARRDLRFSLLSSFVLVAIAGVMSRSSSLLPFMAGWGIASIISLVLFYRRDLAALPRVTAAHVTPTQPRRSRLRRGAVTAALLAGAATGVFLIVPSAGPGRAVAFPTEMARVVPVQNEGGLSNPALGGDNPQGGDGSSGERASFGYFGFSDTLDTSLRGRPDRTLVMRVRAARPDFWKGQTFDTWDGRSWRQSDTDTVTTVGFGPIDLRPTVEDRSVGVPSGEEFVQTIYVERPGPNLIFAAYAPSELYFTDRRVFQLSDGTVRTGVELGDDTVYTVVSRRHPVTAASLRLAGSAPPTTGLSDELVARYMQLPSVPARVEALARELTDDTTNTYDAIRTIESWMGANMTYTLNIPPLPPGADAVEHFLFVDRQGFCEQIASALVVMMRSLGVPARLAVGYVPGERNPFTGMYEVRADDAHAWAEVWFPGVGWQAFDPTAVVPLSGDDTSGSAGAGLFRYIAAQLPSLPSWASTAVAIIVFVGLGTGLVTAVIHWRRARAAAGARAWADRMLDALEAVGAAHGRPRRTSESAARYAAALGRTAVTDERLEQVGALLDRDRYAPDPPGPDQRAWVEAVLSQLSEVRR